MISGLLYETSVGKSSVFFSGVMPYLSKPRLKKESVASVTFHTWLPVYSTEHGGVLLLLAGYADWKIFRDKEAINHVSMILEGGMMSGSTQTRGSFDIKQMYYPKPGKGRQIYA